MREVAEIICQLTGRPKSLIQESDGIRRTIEWQKEIVHDDGIER